MGLGAERKEREEQKAVVCVWEKGEERSRDLCVCVWENGEGREERRIDRERETEVSVYV